MRKNRKIYRALLWLTNNDPKSSCEVQFDIFFFLTGTAVTLYAMYKLWSIQDPAWAAIVWLFYIGFLDTLRHNRTYIK